MQILGALEILPVTNIEPELVKETMKELDSTKETNFISRTNTHKITVSGYGNVCYLVIKGSRVR